MFVRTEWITPLRSLAWGALNHVTAKRPPGAAVSARRALEVLVEPGTVIALEEPTFHRSMWTQGWLEFATQ